jgi:DNA repair ATPase RecN
LGFPDHPKGEWSKHAPQETQALREPEAQADYKKSAKRLSAGRARKTVVLSQVGSEGMQQLAMAGGRFARVVASIGSSRSRTKTLNCSSTNPEGPLHHRLRALAPGGTRCR